ncbi:MAG TPA: prephenate dehydrogenase/arogenate dehydrogenase family protein [Ktedonobacteraceae bacterium]|nr:prephenate dehydrogenase/arogenate dehydrogenase family protein [Ktedonobacteraceae bacterium]
MIPGEELEPGVENAAVLGLGLIGGSFALALRRNDLARHIAGFDADPQVTQRAKQRGAITQVCATPEEAVYEADLVVLASPVLAMRELLERIAPALKRGALVTDTASTKALVIEWAESLLPAHAAFVGGHPMAGKEYSGIDSAEAGLFEGCVYCLARAQQTSPGAIARLSGIVERLGAHPYILDAEQHDRLVAGISHLPFLLSSTMVQTLGAAQDWPEMARLAASGYRDMSRLAAGSPTMYRDICVTNREAILGWLDALEAQLHTLRSYIAINDEALKDYFAQAKYMRDTAVPRQ